MLELLYVDDCQALLEIGARFLEMSGQFSITTTDSAEKALKILENNTFFAIISDLQMPNIDGLDFLKLVRENNENILFILVTGLDDKSVCYQAYNEKVDYYLYKDGNAKTFFNMLLLILQRTSKSKQNEEIALLNNNKNVNLVDTQIEMICKLKPEGKIPNNYEGNRVNNDRDIFFVLNKNLKLLYIPPSTLHIFGYNLEEICSQSILNIISPESYSELFKITTEMAQSKDQISNSNNSKNIELFFYLKNSSVINDEIFITALLDNKNKLIGFIGKNRCNNKMSFYPDSYDNEGNNNELGKNYSSGIALFHQDGIIRYVDKHIETILKQDRCDLINTSVFDYISPTSYQKVCNIIKDRIETGMTKPYQIEITNQFNELFIFNICGLIITFDNLCLHLITINEIIQQKQVSEAMHLQNNVYQNLIENVYDNILIIDSHGMILSSSKKFDEWQGYAFDELIGTKIDLYIHPNDISQLNDVFSTIIPNNANKNRISCRVQHKNKEWHWFSFDIIPFYDEKGMITNYQILVHAIDSYKEDLFSLTQINRQLILLSSITRHDIINYISSVLLYLDIVKMDNNDNSELVKTMDNIETIMGIVQNLLEFSHYYEVLENFEAKWQNIDEILPRDYIPNHISFSSTLPQVFVFADLMLEKVFQNLLDNSIRHGEIVSNIQVYSINSDENLVIIWEDNGIGIIESEKELIFKKGYGKNSGLGMYFIREILLLTGISISECGTPGIGAKFQITVPKRMYRCLDP